MQLSLFKLPYPFLRVCEQGGAADDQRFGKKGYLKVRLFVQGRSEQDLYRPLTRALCTKDLTFEPIRVWMVVRLPQRWRFSKLQRCLGPE